MVGIKAEIVLKTMMNQIMTQSTSEDIPEDISLPGTETDTEARKFTHFDAKGQAHMVDIAAKAPSKRVAVASGRIHMLQSTLQMVQNGQAKKGDVLAVARLAAIMATKRTSDLIPLCHPLSLSHVAVDFAFIGKDAIECTVRAETVGSTGVEMEALLGVQIGLLTVYDMCKAADRGMRIEGVCLLEKRGGASGVWLRSN